MRLLEQCLLEITGMDALTLQPAAGAQGELTGLLLIRAYLEKQGNARRKVLIPDSAHGTNPATAVIAGYEVENIKSDSHGQIDVEKLRELVTEDVAALMVTNPSTLGIFEQRIADIAEAGFIDGMMVVPEFVLRELQVVADSTDGSKRQRGRRGLDMLQRMQSSSNIQVQIVPDDFPSIREVDLKLLELAKKWEAKVVTNDFNLNKVAHLHRVEVLNINDLANALKPVVLPGEKMNVLILKEGKEYNQGVGYLDDGTMVVVDHARRMIGKPVEISVTSVLQTASGKMIFGKLEENGKSGEPVRPGPVEMTH